MAPRNVIFESAATEAIKTYQNEFERFDDALGAMIYRMEHNTEGLKARTILVKGIRHHIYVQTGDAVAKAPQLTALFLQDNNTVTVMTLYAKAVHDPIEDEF